MRKYYSIGEAAKALNITTETLRHYDRINLVKPSRKDELTNYRYYVQEDLIKITTIRALQAMDLSLKEIKKVLDFNDLNSIVNFLEEAEHKADEKIKYLKYSKEKIALAKNNYKQKLLATIDDQTYYIKELPKKVILLSNDLETPTLDNLYSYLRHFYLQVGNELKDKFEFADLAGVYISSNFTRLFAVCNKFVSIDNLKELPEGKYVCRSCQVEEKDKVFNELIM